MSDDLLKTESPKSAVLSSNDIIVERIKGNVVIDPFVELQVNNCSYDVTLGENFWRFTPPEHGVYNMYDQEIVTSCWKLHKATDLSKHANALDTPYIKMAKIKTTDKMIFLKPRETILAHTNEFIGGRNNLTTMMKARSSMGRNFIEVCKCAGWGDVGYTNRWTMEITNNSDCYVPLIVGRRIAQIVFFRTGDLFTNDYVNQADSKYASSREVEELKRKWTPEEMLPKMWKDREAQ